MQWISMRPRQLHQLSSCSNSENAGNPVQAIQTYSTLVRTDTGIQNLCTYIQHLMVEDYAMMNRLTTQFTHGHMS